MKFRTGILVGLIVTVGLVCGAVLPFRMAAQGGPTVQAGQTVTGAIPPYQLYPAPVVVSWPTAFLDDSVTAVCTMLDPSNPLLTLTLTVRNTHAVSATSVLAEVINTGTSAHAGTVHCVGVHP